MAVVITLVQAKQIKSIHKTKHYKKHSTNKTKLSKYNYTY